MDIHLATSAALSLNHSGPKFEAACAICRARGVNPFNWDNVGMMNWQAVCVEALLMKEIIDGF